MAAPRGNQFWKLVKNPGRPKDFTDPTELWDEACKYFDWCDKNPLKAYEWNGKDPVRCDLEKMRAYTIKGLCLFLNIDESTLYRYETEESHKDFRNVVTRVKDVIYTQKFEGASAGLLNPNIIARELGLADKKELNATVKGADGYVITSKSKPVDPQ